MSTGTLVGGFNIGIQRSWTIIDSTTGLPVDYGGDVIDLTSSPNLKHVEINPISTNGYSKYKTNRTGWKGSITVARNNGAGDTFEAAQEALFHAGFTQKYFTIIETTTNDEGTVDTFQYTGCELFWDDAGMARMDSAIEIKMGMNAQSRQPIA